MTVSAQLVCQGFCRFGANMSSVLIRSYARVQERARMACRQHRALGAAAPVVPEHSAQQGVANAKPAV